ncbi:MAG: 2-oxoacid:acceptor oxidoreductase family protein [Candidatus Omnitrophica bacterium]|nr:2-oxoacid:acceptor oxidoreductase family protein [Candidatus Omnitrophota bacterium]MCM8791443.1 2-oxoacid:acceptor oxidoreductase family protein [Candidatus Omnitrophota bacterium]
MKKISKSGCEGILCAGFGGQGIMFMGKLLAEAGLLAGKRVTWMPSYGAEVRGGTAYSMTKISKEAIASPIVTSPDVLIAMNKPSLVKYEANVRPGGLLIYNKTLVDVLPKRKDVKIIGVPMTELASKLGNTRCANMIALGVFLKRSKAVSIRYAVNALKAALKNREDLFALNKKALEKGYSL